TNFSLAGPSNTFLRNFLLSNIVILQSPRPFTLFVGFDANNDLIPAADRVGNLSRNTYKGDSFRSWDIRLSRTINLQERTRLELAADAFNLLNRSNVDEVVGVYGTYNLCGGGQQPREYKDAASRAIQAVQVGGCPAAGPPVPNPLFGIPRTMFNPRQLQMSVKLLVLSLCCIVTLSFGSAEPYSPPRRGGVAAASTESCEATESAADGREARARQREAE